MKISQESRKTAQYRLVQNASADDSRQNAGTGGTLFIELAIFKLTGKGDEFEFVGTALVLEIVVVVRGEDGGGGSVVIDRKSVV